MWLRGPPREGSFSYVCWQSLGFPPEPKRSFADFYGLIAEEHWKNKKDLNKNE